MTETKDKTGHLIIRKYRKEKGITQKQLAKEAQFSSVSSISKIEAGEFTPKRAKVADIAKALRLNRSQTIELFEGYQFRLPTTTKNIKKFSDDSLFAVLETAQSKEKDPINMLRHLFFLIHILEDLQAAYDYAVEKSMALFNYEGFIEIGILEELISSREALSYGIQHESLLSFKKAKHHADKAENIYKNIKTQIKPKERRLLIEAHLYLCLASCYFYYFYAKYTDTFLADDENIGGKIRTYFKIVEQLYDNNIFVDQNDLVQYLFVKRGLLRFLANEVDSKDKFAYQSAIHEILPESKEEEKSENDSMQAFARTCSQLLKDTREPTSKIEKILDQVFNPGSETTLLWFDAIPEYESVLVQHQNSFNVKSIHHVINHTFICYPVFLARAQKFEKADTFLNGIFFSCYIQRESLCEWYYAKSLVHMLKHYYQGFETAEFSQALHYYLLSIETDPISEMDSHIEDDYFMTEPILFLCLLRYINNESLRQTLNKEQNKQLDEIKRLLE